MAWGDKGEEYRPDKCEHPEGGGCMWCCQRCNYDTHWCPGCGTVTDHEDSACDECLAQHAKATPTPACVAVAMSIGVVVPTEVIPARPFDYRKMLINYLNVVGEAEGVIFDGAMRLSGLFTNDELTEMHRLAFEPTEKPHEKG